MAHTLLSSLAFQILESITMYFNKQISILRRMIRNTGQKSGGSVGDEGSGVLVKDDHPDPQGGSSNILSPVSEDTTLYPNTHLTLHAVPEMPAMAARLLPTPRSGYLLLTPCATRTLQDKTHSFLKMEHISN